MILDLIQIKRKKKLNLSTTNIIINNSNGFLDKLRRQNCVEYLYPKNEIERFSNGFLIVILILI